MTWQRNSSVHREKSEFDPSVTKEQRKSQGNSNKVRIHIPYIA